ncbi:MAG: hypothetical protein QOG31_221 [Thermoplasmata archaeon]|nr:hypothetical protein [Thermoplasmata archaeon]
MKRSSPTAQLVRIVTHILVIATTRAGKTTWTNKLHRTFPGISIFVDTKASLADAIWGVRVRSLPQAWALIKAGHKKIVWDPPRTATGIDFPAAHAQLAQFWGLVQLVGRRHRIKEGRPYIQLILDEAQQWEGTYVVDGVSKRHPPILEDMAARGLGLGLRLVYVTQDPIGVQRKTRTNLNTRIILAPGEGELVLRQWGLPVDWIKSITAQPYHFVSYVREFGWRAHRPIRA